ncbi:MAG: hypothetical protein WDZ85_02175 [Candidatus Paceibacterota bacterium]
MTLQQTENKASLEDVLHYDNHGVVSRLSRNLCLPMEEAEELFRDTLTFLWLTQQENESIAPPSIIDEGWHSFILFTRDYAEFCQREFGVFIHHVPKTERDSVSDRDCILRTIKAVKKHLDPVLISDNWGWAKEGAISGRVGCGLDCSPDYDCNGTVNCT